jgi:hypothetical protein
MLPVPRRLDRRKREACLERGSPNDPARQGEPVDNRAAGIQLAKPLLARHDRSLHLNAKTHWSKTDLLIQHFTSTLETPNQRPTTVSHKNGKEDEASGSDACEAGRFRYLGYPVSNGSPKSRRDEKSKGCRELLCVDKVRQN